MREDQGGEEVLALRQGKEAEYVDDEEERKAAARAAAAGPFIHLGHACAVACLALPLPTVTVTLLQQNFALPRIRRYACYQRACC